MLLARYSQIRYSLFVKGTGILSTRNSFADNNERQTKALVPILTATPNVSDIHFPTGTKFLRLTKNYGYIDTNMSEEEKEKALMFAKTGFMDTSGKTQFIFITHAGFYSSAVYHKLSVVSEMGRSKRK